ncbi:MAG: Hpt domain-containing protein [Parvibaculum sp.]|nr:Hpt domain-containing protein [Parvibaculum sp.]|tara:strand:- start:1748 stop:2263 length:516 start_codon:yes stop_codon:yes gene_type:complete
MSSENQEPVVARFVRLPSIAERKLGPDYSAPIRLDPRVLNQMQATIKTLGKQYVDTLGRQVHELLPMIADACSGDQAQRSAFYEIVHDVRGLAGTFGHPIVGKFAKSLCHYMQEHATIDQTIVRFHIEAMRDALADAAADDRLAEDTLNSLAQLIRTAEDARTPARKSPVG